MNELLLSLGIVLVILGFLLLILAAKPAEGEWAVGGFIGPVPFGFASSHPALYLLILILAVLAVLLFLGKFV